LRGRGGTFRGVDRDVLVRVRLELLELWRREEGRPGVWAGRLRGLSDLPYSHYVPVADGYGHGHYHYPVFDEEG